MGINEAIGRSAGLDAFSEAVHREIVADESLAVWRRGRQQLRRQCEMQQAAPPPSFSSRRGYNICIAGFEGENFAGPGGVVVAMPEPAEEAKPKLQLEAAGTDAIDQLDGIISQQLKQGVILPGMKVTVVVVDPKSLKTRATLIESGAALLTPSDQHLVDGDGVVDGQVENGEMPAPTETAPVEAPAPSAAPAPAAAPEQQAASAQAAGVMFSSVPDAIIAHQPCGGGSDSLQEAMARERFQMDQHLRILREQNLLLQELVRKSHRPMSGGILGGFGYDLAFNAARGAAARAGELQRQEILRQDALLPEQKRQGQL